MTLLDQIPGAAPASGTPEPGTPEPGTAPESDREAYRRTLLELAREDSRIWCLDSDMGGLEKLFEPALPGQYVDLGIAEANLMTVAAALAGNGILPFVNTMAAFASARALEQLKVDISYPALPVRIVGSHAGFSAATLGPTHHAQHDLATLRCLPNLTVMTPADAGETVRMVRAAAYLPGPVYIRLGRGPTPPVYDRPRPEDGADGDSAAARGSGPEGTGFTVGRAVRMRAGADVTLIAAGCLPVHFALDAARLLAEDGIDAAVLNMHTIKPLDVPAVVHAARTTAGLVTVEDHSVLGGLGGAVAEAVVEHHPTRVVRIGAADAYSSAPGSHHDHLLRSGVSVERIVAAARQLTGLAPPGARP